jgi:hypothetical protein
MTPTHGNTGRKVKGKRARQQKWNRGYPARLILCESVKRFLANKDQGTIDANRRGVTIQQ